MTHKILLIHGANLNLLGKRQPHLYGKTTLEELQNHLTSLLSPNTTLQAFQSNHEGEILDFLNQQFLIEFEKKGHISGIIINPGAFTHTSIALRDALEVFKDLGTPIYEVHLSNIFKREEFRHTSFVSGIANGVICGLGVYGYEVALRMLDQNTLKC